MRIPFSGFSDHSRGAFTLIELLSVIAIIGVLFAILIPSVANVRERTKFVEATSDVRSIALAWRLYYSDRKAWPDQTDFVGGNASDTKSYETSDGEVFWSAYVKLLSGNFNVGEQPFTRFNPARDTYLEILDRTIDANGEFIDPWGNPYKFKLDTSTNVVEGIARDSLRVGDGRIGRFNYSDYGSPENSRPGQVVVEDIAIAWSRGADGRDDSPEFTEDEPRSW